MTSDLQGGGLGTPEEEGKKASLSLRADRSLRSSWDASEGPPFLPEPPRSNDGGPWRKVWIREEKGARASQG